MKKIAVITGAAQGLGFAIANELANDHFHVILLDRKKEQLKIATEQLLEQGHQASGIEIDLEHTEKIQDVLSQIAVEHGKIHVLVNNAGINIVKPFDEVTSDNWDKVMNINLKASFFMIQHAAPLMEDSGSIINISSIASNSPRPLSVAYAASKAGMVSLTKTASIVLAPRRIRVNAICPGAMETELLEKMSLEMGDLSGTSPEESLQNYLGAIPLGRISTPSDIAKSVAFLASDNANYITGQSLNVCGGLTVT
ncbi:SDR family NAD(P)-dependent oxidoreductase [Sutcliffiella rhizosphaerae]|uniref:3-oxoacyl-[acyl-carrier-protein] reductase FabG n=1 Tax=Sutcliffiella rhizosphaerae TaxID=2880967 RepID=A0ABN8ABZ4_9BACI|nr:SDR family NAD(P)-dependent oxidoreductase [Sutcliffiella rhizosphaerae]CAG9622740.1 3-oxoacyl-[acyl-carrier-protein] reductase FabG [Sutcliffiella rhizosphaerae]